MSIRQIGSTWRRLVVAMLIAALPVIVVAIEAELTIAGVAGGAMTTAHLAKFLIKNNAAGMANNKQGTIDIRYAMPAPEDEFDDTCGYDVIIRYRDNGTSANVKVKVMEQSLLSNANNELYLFDSDDASSPANTNSNQTFSESTPLCFNFGDFVYYLQVELQKTALDGDPRFAGFTIDPGP